MRDMTSMNEAAAIKTGERIPAATLASFIARALAAAGLPQADAETVAGLMTEADLRGSDTHGVIRLPLYLRRTRARRGRGGKRGAGVASEPRAGGPPPRGGPPPPALPAPHSRRRHQR